MIFNMPRRFLVAIVIIIAICPLPLQAQRGGGRGSHGGTATTPKGEPAEDNSLKDFSRAIALQADAGQIDLFHQLTKDTTTAADKAGDLAQHPERIKQQADILAYVVEVARGESHDFIQELSRAQRSGLKTWRKNVERADAEVGKSWKTLSKDLTRDSGGEKRLAADNLNLQQSLAKLLTEQGRLAQRMSIPLGSSEGDDHPGGQGPIDLHARPLR